MGPRLSKHFGLVNDKIQTVKVGEIVDWLIGIVENSRHRLKKREVGKEGGREGGWKDKQRGRGGKGRERRERRERRRGTRKLRDKRRQGGKKDRKGRVKYMYILLL